MHNEMVSLGRHAADEADVEVVDGPANFGERNFDDFPLELSLNTSIFRNDFGEQFTDGFYGSWCCVSCCTVLLLDETLADEVIIRQFSSQFSSRSVLKSVLK